MSRHMNRVNVLLRQEISHVLAQNTKDPRLATIITITNVDSSADLRYAKVFASVLGTKEEQQDTLHGLISASGFIRQALQQRLSLRCIPQMQFILDDSIEHGTKLLGMIKKLSSQRLYESD